MAHFLKCVPLEKAEYIAFLYVSEKSTYHNLFPLTLFENRRWGAGVSILQTHLYRNY